MIVRLLPPRRALALLLACAAIPGVSGVAHAESSSAKLVRQLAPDTDTVRHPLADRRGRVPFLVELEPGQDARSLGLIEVAPGIASASLLPDDLASFAALHAGRPMSVTPGSRTQVAQGRKLSGAPGFIDSGGGTGEGVVVGIVDTGIDLTHPGFQDESGHTRVAWLLTWGPPVGLHPELEEAFGCTDPDQSECAIFSAADLDEMVAGSQGLREDLHDFVGHGTHVAGIAAGNGERGPGKSPINVGMAPGATLVIAAPSEGGSFRDAEVLRGTRFIFDRAEEMGMPAVVNLSLGGDYGPHDGTSLLEKGNAAFVGDDRPGRVIVAAAGNSGGLYQIGDTHPLGIHTEVHVEDHAPVRVPIFVPEAEGGDVYVWLTFRPGDEVSVGLEGPDGADWIGTVGPGDEAGYKDDEVSGTVINNVRDEGSSLSPDTNGALVAFYGTWPADSTFALHLEGHGDAQLWMVAQGAARQGGYFVQATKQGTINQPASHPRILAVGCTINRLSWPSLEAGLISTTDFGQGEVVVDEPCYFSAAGPTPLGVAKPEIVAPGGFVASALSAAADPREQESSIFSGFGCPDETECYVSDHRYAITSGTSMSSPFVAGAAALLLQQDASLTQARVTEILQASARKIGGPVRYGSQVGAGALDVRHALAVLAEEGGMGPPPDLAQSWWFLSAESARPDPSWKLLGNVQLRRTDGSIASGLDGSLLAVRVEGGALVRQPSKVIHGHYQFEVAGERGAGGTSMRVTVLYDGKPIGETLVLPVAIDEWAADGEPRAAGGICSMGASGAPGSRRASHVTVLVAAAAIALLRRARRAGRARASSGAV